MKNTQQFTHPIDHYLENPEAPFAEAGLIAWATMKTKRDARTSITAKRVYDGMLGNPEVLERIMSDPEKKQEFIQLIIDMPR